MDKGYKDYLKAKREGFTTRPRRNFPIRPNGRSSDFVAPGLATGCQLTCTYCYVARHRQLGNPLEIYTNREQIWEAVEKHANSRPKKEPNQCDPVYWTYDIGESSDCLTSKNIDNTNWYINQFMQHTNAKPTFATKVANVSRLTNCSDPRRARIRMSIAPQNRISFLEKSTSTLKARIRAIQQLYDKGYEVHLNFSPIVVSVGWTTLYSSLLDKLDTELSDEVKSQLNCEVIFLTHSHQLHQSNTKHFYSQEELLYVPPWQEEKITGRGGSALRYSRRYKPHFIEKFKYLIDNHLPSCQIRYIF